MKAQTSPTRYLENCLRSNNKVEYSTIVFVHSLYETDSVFTQELDSLMSWYNIGSIESLDEFLYKRIAMQTILPYVLARNNARKSEDVPLQELEVLNIEKICGTLLLVTMQNLRQYVIEPYSGNLLLTGYNVIVIEGFSGIYYNYTRNSVIQNAYYYRNCRF